MREVIDHLRQALLPEEGPGLTDAELLDNYVARRDEAAVAVLVRRHGPMVWGVCRRILDDPHDAEDAFQATFLVFVRKAATLDRPSFLANWLHQVARQTARKARSTIARRRGKEGSGGDFPEPEAIERGPRQDVLALLDEELGRLPDKYRLVIVLCDLEGKTRKEAAKVLDCPEGTVAGRLARARHLLAKRLDRRGGGLTCLPLPAVVPATLVHSTVRATASFATGQSATGSISPHVLALTEGVLQAMLSIRLAAVSGAICALALAGCLAGAFLQARGQ